MKKQTLTAARHRQKQVETAYYEDALLNMLLSAQLMCLIKNLGHSREEINAASEKVTKADIIKVLTEPLNEKDKEGMTKLLNEYFELTNVGFGEEMLEFFCHEESENSKENAND